MVMGNCFSPVMEGSQFQWNNIVVNSPVYITPIRRKKFKISFGEFDLFKVLLNVSSNCDIIIRDGDYIQLYTINIPNRFYL